MKKTYFIPARCNNELIRFNSADRFSIALSSTVIWVSRSNVIAIYNIDDKVKFRYSSQFLQIEIPQNTNL